MAAEIGMGGGGEVEVPEESRGCCGSRESASAVLFAVSGLCLTTKQNS